MELLELPVISSCELKRESGETWKCYFYEEYEELFIDNNACSKKVSSRLINYINLEQFLRIQLYIECIPFLVAFIPGRKEVRFYSPRLGREMFLIEQLEAVRGTAFYKNDNYKKLKAHCDLVAKISLKHTHSTYDMIEKRMGKHGVEFDRDSLNQEVQKKSNELSKYLNQYKPSFFERLTDYGLNLTANFALLRIHLLKFLAILPNLDHDVEGEELKRILIETLRRLIEDNRRSRVYKKEGQLKPLPNHLVALFQVVLSISKIIPSKTLAFLVRSSVRFTAKRFIAGESIQSVESAFHTLFSSNRDVTLDQLGELVVSRKEADNYCNQVIELIEGFHLHVPVGEKNRAGILRAHVSIKVSALCHDFKPHAFDYTFNQAAPRLAKILKKAKEHQVYINIDAEHYHYRDTVFEVYKKVLLETHELSDYQQTGIVLQAYLRDAFWHLEDIVELAKERGLKMPIRIVKGAYWDAETIEAEAHGFDAPEFLNKEETDLNFRRLTLEIMKHDPHVQVCLASHNIADHCYSEVLREMCFPESSIIEHQCLHMTYEALSVGLAKKGWVVRNYVPIGSLLVGMAYLVRRIMENSSQVGILTIMRSHKKKAAIEPPEVVHQNKKETGEVVRDRSIAKLTSDFFNAPPVLLYKEKHLDSIKRSIDEFSNKLGYKYKNDFELTGQWQEVLSNSDLKTVVGHIQNASIEDAKRALEASEEDYNNGSWSQSQWVERSSVLLKAASIMMAKRNELTSLICYESGKSIYEALADVDEAIDFLNFYAREERKTHVHGKDMTSRGPVVSITPWNFPIAIPTGMTCAPLAAGNTVILKCAEQTPLIAGEMVKILHEAGVPKDSLIFLPGEGEVIGDYLIRSEKISTVVFTGSKEVGTHISSVVNSGFYHNKLLDKKIPKKAITEMGGKNAVIVTANSEPDETIDGVLYSAFAHAGQKCSAASRVIVHHSVKDKFIERLKEACHDIKVGSALDFSTVINPVVSKEEKDRLIRQTKEAIVEAKEVGGRVIVDRSQEDLPGACIGPVVIELPIKAAFERKSFAQRELFGPVIHVMAYQDREQAIEFFNSVEYGLTGGAFSQSQDDIDYLLTKLEAGNIYINRTITGARVGIEPFGGFKLSGTGPKAGGKGYLGAFHYNNVEAKISDSLIEEGSDYRFDLCRASGLSVKSRIHRAINGVDFVIHHFETLYQGLMPGDKKLLKRFFKWLRRNGEAFQEKQHWNVKIPGQLSYNDFSMTPNHVVVASSSLVPSITVLLRVMCAVAMGAGVTVLAQNQETFSFWNKFLHYFLQSGFSKENLDVYFVNQKQLDSTLRNPELSIVIADGPMEYVEKVCKVVFDESLFEAKHAKKVLSDFDKPHRTDFKRMCAEFIWVRAFAINTMRHGAPLDLKF